MNCLFLLTKYQIVIYSNQQAFLHGYAFIFVQSIYLVLSLDHIASKPLIRILEKGTGNEDKRNWILYLKQLFY